MVEVRQGLQNSLASTCRCLTEDLEFSETTCAGTLTDIAGHPLVRAFLERRSVSPVGSESPIQQLRPLFVYSLHSGRHRGATLYQEKAAVVWLLAAHIHRADSPDDAYNYFEQLQLAGRLLPTTSDAARVVAAREPRFDTVAGDEIPDLRRVALRDPGTLHEKLLGGRISVRVSYENGDAGLLIVAISTKIHPGALPLPTQWLGIVLAAFFPETALPEVDGVAEIGGGPLREDELGFCALIQETR